MTADVAIVGAGSAGNVLAARLTEDTDREVVLLEAGPDYRTVADLPPEIRSGLRPVYTHDWGYRADTALDGRVLDANRARIVGGCSATNAALAVRGRLADYDRWAALGGDGWSFADVLPYFRRLEHDYDFDGDAHGRDGPFPICRPAPEELAPVQRAFLDACANAGFPVVEDHNAPGAVGAGLPPMNLINGVRQSTALTYLAGARDRPNLTLRSDAPVDRVELDGARAVGVRLAESGELIEADRVLLASGAYGSPAILMRTGIGPAGHLGTVGIDPVLDRPGVGANLIEHPLMPNVFEARSLPRSGDRVFQAMLTAPSSTPDGLYDLHVLPLFNPPELQGDPPVFVILAGLMTPQSRGSVRLCSADPHDAPRIDLGLFTNAADMPRMLDAVRIARRLATTEPLRDLLGEQITPGADATTDDALAAAVRAGCEIYQHPVGTCRMGAADDPDSVVDARGAVHGVRGLSVIDASIMPSIPAANTNVPTIMIAERCAAWLRGES
ncbi:MAG: GMC family oxidoreductase [Acidimicrobiia bacterium]